MSVTSFLKLCSKLHAVCPFCDICWSCRFSSQYYSVTVVIEPFITRSKLNATVSRVLAECSAISLSFHSRLIAYLSNNYRKNSKTRTKPHCGNWTKSNAGYSETNRNKIQFCASLVILRRHNWTTEWHGWLIDWLTLTCDVCRCMCVWLCRYDPVNDAWTELPAMCRCRVLACSVVYENKIYVMGL